MKVTVDLDLEDVVKRAKELPEEIARPEDVAEGLRSYYRQDGERLRLDTVRRDELVAHLSDRIDKHALQAENTRLKDEGRRRKVVEYVRMGLAAQSVRPELLDAAVALFIAQHKFGLKDGKVIAVGQRGAEEAELAAVNWIADQGEAYVGSASSGADTGGFAAQVARLKSMH
jgi:hypothetical protein